MKPEEKLVHPFAPVYDEKSRVLILGSFPSAASREQGFYYGHPRNRFWRILADWAGEEMPLTVPERREFLARHGIALWDVLESCRIIGSSDASIRDAKPNDLRRILDCADIRKILVNGATAKKYYDRYQLVSLGRQAILLPSTSPANAAYSLCKLEEIWMDALS